MAKDSPIEFKGTSLTIIQAFLQTTDLLELEVALADLTGNASDFFDDALAVLDFSAASDLPVTVDWDGIRKLLRQSGLHAIATFALPEALAAEALSIGLPPVSSDALGRLTRTVRSGDSAPAAPAPAPAPAPVAAAQLPAATMVIDKPLRSGQRVYAKGADLIVTAMVSAGAEVIADGNIHVYAPLRGRALAGASGDKSARIFTTSLEAELVSVAGLYRMFEAGVPADLARQPATISLSDEGGQAKLQVMPLALR